MTTDLQEDVFETIGAGETVTAEFDVAVTHDLSSGGTVDLSSEGVFSYAEPNTTEIAGVVPYTSNQISAEVDGSLAAAARDTFIDRRRSIVQSDCTGTRLTAIRTAESNCASLSRAASTAASSGSAAKVEEYCKFSGLDFYN